MSLVQQIFLKLSEPVALSSYQSVWQLATALNLALSGYTELRTKIEGEIEARTESADRKIREVLYRRKEALAKDRKNLKCNNRVQTAEKYRQKLSKFNEDYYAARAKWRKSDRFVLRWLLSWAVISLLVLTLSSSGLATYEINNPVLIFAASFLVLPVGVAVVRTLWLSGSVKRTHRKKAVYITGQITRLFNADFLTYRDQQEEKTAASMQDTKSAFKAALPSPSRRAASR